MLPLASFQQQPKISTQDRRIHALNVLLDTAPQLDIILPPGLTPPNPVVGSSDVSQFFMLDDGKTGVLALGSFSANSFDGLETSMLNGLLTLKDSGATQLIVDVVRADSLSFRPLWSHRVLVRLDRKRRRIYLFSPRKSTMLQRDTLLTPPCFT